MSALDTSSLRPLYTGAQVGELDRRTIASGIEGFALMQRAAASAWHSIRARWPQARSLTVVCGKGHNGGDGHVLAALAAQAGLRVKRVMLVDVKTLQGDPCRAAELATAAGVEITAWHRHLSLTADVVVDALLGTGFKGVPDALSSEVIGQLNALTCPVVAIDVPSGLEADTGHVPGVAVRAALTVTFIGDKLGLYTGAAPDHVGEVDFRPLGVKAGACLDIPPSAWRIAPELLASAFPPRARTMHKGAAGHLLVIGGCPGMGGAALIASQAGARLGAGRVSLATAAEHVMASLIRCPEVMAHGVRGVSDLKPLATVTDTWVVGPGLGQSSFGQAMMQSALEHSGKLVVDADGLNLLARDWPTQCRSDWVLTPHPGEAARLLGVTTREVQADRPGAARALQRQRGGVILLKGAGSLVATADTLYVCPFGNPGMASGGMGDALSGMVGALLAQGLAPEASAVLGCLVHALAADRVAAGHGERGLLASDLVDHARWLINSCEETS